jgi:hypothetical protein
MEKIDDKEVTNSGSETSVLQYPLVATGRNVIETAAGPVCSACGRGVGVWLSHDQSPCICSSSNSKTVDNTEEPDLYDAISAHAARGGRVVFWTCPNGCHDIVDWYHHEDMSMAVCRRCGASNMDMDDGVPATAWEVLGNPIMMVFILFVLSFWGVIVLKLFKVLTVSWPHLMGFMLAAIILFSVVMAIVTSRRK